MINELAEIEKYLTQNTKVVDRNIKKGSFYDVISQILGAKVSELRGVYDRYYQTASTGNKKTETELFPILFSKNLIIYSYENHKVKETPIYANVYNTSACADICLVSWRNEFYAVREADKKTSVEDIFHIIEDPSSNVETFLEAFNSISTQERTKTYQYSFKDAKATTNFKCTIFYYICFHGKIDMIKGLIQTVKFDGAQDELTQNTPLHIASFRGHQNAVVILLVLGIKPTKNGEGKFPSDFRRDLVPPRSRVDLIAIWNSYKQGFDKFCKDYSNFKVVADLGEKIVENNHSIETESKIEVQTDRVSVESICEFLENTNLSPIPLEEFQKMISILDKSLINNISKNFSCTIFYLACRKGDLGVVQHLMSIKEVKTSGAQETYSGKGNTPLHVANWRGNTRVVAYLLAQRVPIEKQTGGKKSTPKDSTEKNPALSEEIRTNLNSILSLGSSKKYDQLKDFYDIKENTFTEIESDQPLPLWFFLAVPKEEPGFQYGKFSHLFYHRELRQGSIYHKLSFFDPSTTCFLNYLYLQYRKNPSKNPFTVGVPTLPSFNIFIIFSREIKWNYDNVYIVDFKERTIKIKGVINELVVATRPRLWYYSLKPGDVGPYLPFPHKLNSLITENSVQGKLTVQFPYARDKGFFAKSIVCLVNFEKSVVTMSTGKAITDNALLIEKDYVMRTFFDPQSYFPRNDEPKELKRLDSASEEYRLVSKFFAMSMSTNCKIVSITTILDFKANQIYEKSKEATQEQFQFDLKLKAALKYQTLLWYGPGSYDPTYVLDTGIKSNTNYNRIWGKGWYFSPEASYSANHAFTTPSRTKKIVLAKVVTANSFYAEDNTSLESLPQYFNSLYTFKNGSWVYCVFHPEQFYANYIVEFEEPKD